MQLKSVDSKKIAMIFAILYGIVGLLPLPIFAASQSKMATLPLGFIFGMFHLTFNLSFSTPTTFLGSMFIAALFLIGYAFDGWITGLVFGIALNAIMKRVGGVNLMGFTIEEAPGKPAEPKAETVQPSTD